MSETGDQYFGYDGFVYGDPHYSDSADDDSQLNDVSEDATIEQIRYKIMHEQPGNAKYRAAQWNDYAELLAKAESKLRSQSLELEETWESPAAKDAFLRRVGKVLAYLRGWQRAASANGAALSGLAKVMREYQREMKELWEDYQAWQRNNIPEDKRNRPLTGPLEEAKKSYDQKARDLGNRAASSYAEYLPSLRAGRAGKMVPLNAVVHPDAFGPKAPTPPAAPPAPPAAAPPASSPAPTPPPATPPAVVDPPEPPPAPGYQPTPPPVVGTTPVLPALPISAAPITRGIGGMTPPAFRPAPGIAPATPGSGTARAVPGVANSLRPAPAPGATSGLLRPPVSQPSSQPPLVPPGALRPTGTPAPGSSGNTPKKPPGQQKASADGKVSGRSTPPAFVPPTGNNAPVLGAKQRSTKRRARRKASRSGTAATRGATPPLLVNRNLAPPAKTYTEQRAEFARTKREHNESAQASEFAAAPDTTPAVYAGRLEPSTDTSHGDTVEVPTTLRGSLAHDVDPDRDPGAHVHADRTARHATHDSANSSGNQPAAIADNDVWEVATPGGPVVSGGEAKQPEAKPGPMLGSN